MGRGVGVSVVGMGAVAVVRMGIVTMVRMSVVGVGVMRVGVTASTTATGIMYMLCAVRMRMGVLLRIAMSLGFFMLLWMGMAVTASTTAMGIMFMLIILRMRIRMFLDLVMNMAVTAAAMIIMYMMVM